MRVLTLGTFDPPHPGHVGLFAQCRRIAQGGEVVVAVNSDKFILNYRGKAPLMAEGDRVGVLEAFRDVDRVVVNRELLGQALLIEEIKPDCIVIGQDWALKDYLTQLRVTQPWLDDRNIQLCYVPRTGEWSSTEIKNAVGQ
jgi:cytidyltransferase-like protein